MPVHEITEKQLAGALRREGKHVRGAIRTGMRRSAYRGKADLIRATDEKHKVDQGQYKNSFHVERRPSGGYELYNDAPHAGIIELGARPHPVNREGVEAIRQWVIRKLEIPAAMAEENEDTINDIVWGIVRKLQTHGQAPTYIFRDEIPTLKRYLKEEVERAVNSHRTRGGEWK